MRQCTIVILISVLSLIDGTMTLCWVLFTDATELNPIMKPLIDCHPIIFLVIKTGTVTFFLIILWIFRKNRLARIGLNLLLVIYFSVVIYHGWAIVKFVI